MIDISIVINAHREHLLLHPCLRSVEAAVAAARAAGLSCETLIALDRPDAATRDYLAAHPLAREARLETLDFGDLSSARNWGAEASRGEYVAYLDGDDLWSANWLAKAHAAASALEAAAVWHPSYNLVFGAGEPYYYLHTDMDDPDFELDWFRVENYWTALSLAPRQVFLEHPYHPNRIDEGFGYEDWGWNLRTIEAGIRHKTVPGTMHFIRRKTSGSLLDQTRQRHALPDWGPMFGPQTEGPRPRGF